MTKRIDITGQRFGRLVVTKYSHSNANGVAFWECKCDCGNVKVIRGNDLRGGKITSCKCYNREISSTHNMTGTKIHQVWSNMKARCNNPNIPNYKNYGARGITVCDRWEDFKNFFDDMGGTYKEGLSIERIDVNGNYEPSNCKWATIAEQQNNRRCSRKYQCDGELLTAKQIANKYGLNFDLVVGRLKKGMPVREAIERPSMRHPDNDLIKETYKKVKTIRQVYLKTGYSWTYIKKVLTEEKIV